ncbi:hypothetical protein GCK72_003487 [Caenorhabditis remanei]|uniref:Uncharacterized protein n=1 Tax=Caenorhabditis remanei TaxID=31234 RepID=A0A6A5HTV8_CAERE|nr:hypothetical protein GCK72_003487 [Caenorhabditis remanei]KAF1771660.1 hypothetical protein GCK72_003487 [Caenorhabditis remanei]
MVRKGLSTGRLSTQISGDRPWIRVSRTGDTRHVIQCIRRPYHILHCQRGLSRRQKYGTILFLIVCIVRLLGTPHESGGARRGAICPSE